MKVCFPTREHDVPMSSVPFVHRLAVVLPTSDGDAISATATATAGFFYLAHLTLDRLIDSDFININMRHGSFCAVSAAAADRACAVTVHGGQLVLDLDADTFHTLGLSGQRSRQDTQRYTATISLLDPSFVPGEPLYDRVHWCFAGRTQAFHLLALRTVDGRSADIVFPEGVVHRTVVVSSQVSGLIASCPIFDQMPQGMSPVWSAFGVGFLEWLGAVLCGATDLIQSVHTSTGEKEDDGFVNNYCCKFQTSSTQTSTHLKTWQWAGMVPAAHIQACIDDVSQLVEGGNVPWGVVVTWGFCGSQICHKREGPGSGNSVRLLHACSASSPSCMKPSAKCSYQCVQFNF